MTADMLAPARRVAEALDGAAKVTTLVIYGGDEERRTSGITVLPWSRLHEQRVTGNE